MTSKFHIGSKIKEVVEESGLTVAAFASLVNLSRDGAYKVFRKDTIDTHQLHTISKVLQHDFFEYYRSNGTAIKERTEKYDKYVLREEYEELKKEFDTIKEQMKHLVPKPKAVYKRPRKKSR